MFLLTDSQASMAKARAEAAMARAGVAMARAGVAMASAREQARRAAEQAGPMTASARTAAGTGIHHARVWAAPRLDRTGHALEDQVAPRMAAMLSAAAQRIEPAPVRRRSRWLLLVAVLIAAAGLSAAAAYLLKRRAAASAPEPSVRPDAASPTGPAGEPADQPASDASEDVHTG